MRRARAPYALAALALVALAGDGNAQSKTGTTVGTFLKIEPDARIAGMGNAGVSVGSGLVGYYYNPAAVALIDKKEIRFSHSAWIADIAFDHISAAFPLGKAGTAALSITSLRSGDIAVTTVDQPLGTGELYHVSDFAAGGGWARPITDRFSIGAEAMYVQETIWNNSLRALVFHLGTLYRSSPNGLVLGASLSNLGTGGQFDGRDLAVTFDQDPNANGDNSTIPAELLTDQFGVPTLLRFGLAYPYAINPMNKLRFEADALHESDNSESVNLGAEYAYRERFALRAGWQSLFQKDAEGGLTLGAGWTGDLNNALGFDFAYAYADQGRLGAVHRLTVGVDF